MRLTCPNCGAQYEVPDDVIPEEGRDVQCSNCGDTWFQQPAGSLGAAATPAGAPPVPEARAQSPEAGAETPAEATPEVEFASAPDQADPQISEPVEQDQSDEPSRQTGPQSGPQSDPQTELQTEARQEDAPASNSGEAEPAEQAAAAKPAEQRVADTDEDTTAPAETVAASTHEPAAAPTQRGLDPALGDILREEAQREANLRAEAQSSQSQGLETQPNLGLDDLPEDEDARRSRQAQDRMARIRGEDPRRLAAEASGLKRGVLPDIEEINSTLRAGETTPPSMAPDMTPRPRKSGFTRGFALIILAAVALVMVYSNAPQIAELAPQADPYLSSYVAWVDEMRLWLDQQVTALQQPRG
ncbi:zinc-ribbon domain-containing protein [Pseudophaeobacter sp.]|uniref:zinc-ribbon domain-containing protein n=1 Tax=Pseudophaeobacter sp. TaxID=1971739 RepID=UPI0040586DA5